MKYLAYLICVLCSWSGSLLAEGKLVIRANAPGAQIYLDGNFIANGDGAGRLHIDQLPDGRFMITVKKSGFRSQSRTVEIVANQTTDVYFELQSVERESAGKPGPGGVAQQRERKPRKNTASAPVTLVAPPVDSAKASVSAPQETKSPSDHRNVLYVSVAIIALCATIITFFFLKFQMGLRWRTQPSSNVAEAAVKDAEPSGPLPIEPSKTQSDGAFLAELEHREELLRAGFISDPVPKRKRRKRLDEPSEQTITLDKDDYEVKN